MADRVDITVENSTEVSAEVLSANSYRDLYLVFDKTSEDTISHTFNEVAGRFDTTKKTLTNISSVDSIKVNGATVSGSFRVDNGDTLEVSITRSDNTVDSKIQFEAQ